MIERRLLQFIVRLFFTLSVPFLLLSVSARLLLSAEFLRIEYQRPGFPSDIFGFTLQDRLQYSPHAIDYLFNDESIDFLAAVRLPADKCWNLDEDAVDCPLFSERELRHMVDVKYTTTTLFALAAACAIICAAIGFASRHVQFLQSEIRVGIRRGCLLALLSIMFLAVLSAAAWDRAFDAFHQLFFAAGTWRFPFSDSLIRLYPEQLFVDAALVIAGLTALGAALILAMLSVVSDRALWAS